MRRPYRALCGILLGLAVVVGCAKKPKTDEVSSNTTTPAVQPADSGAGKGQQPPGPSAGRIAPGRIYTADDPNDTVPIPSAKAAAPAGGVTAAGGGTTAPAPAGKGGPVDLVQGGFDKVEAALTAAKGKVVLVDCWAVWCPPCVATFPKLVEKHEKYKDKGLVCLSVSLDAGRNQPDKVLTFLKQRNATFQNFYMTNPGDPRMDARFGKIEFIPYAVLLNKKGEKIWSGNPGGSNETKVTGMIETELAK